MVNQQLKDYVSEQLRVGVSREAIRSALLEAGWAERDVNEALGMPQANVVMKPVSTSPTVNGVRPATPISIPAARVVGSSAASSAAKPTASTFSFKSAQRESQPVQPKPLAATPKQRSAPATSFVDAVVNPHPAAKLSTAHRVAHAVMGLAILALGAGGTWLFLRNTNLVRQVGTLTSNNEGLASELGSLKAQYNALRAQVEDLASENKGLRQALGLFVAPAGTAGAVQEITVDGILVAGSGTAPYTLKMPAGITLTLKNSRDAAIEQVLKPLADTDISILGRHALGSKDITVLQVNGAAPARAAP